MGKTEISQTVFFFRKFHGWRPNGRGLRGGYAEGGRQYYDEP